MSTSALARDPLPFEGVAGRPVCLAWKLTDADLDPADLGDVTQVEVSIRKRVQPGEDQPATTRLRLTAAEVSLDLEDAQIAAELEAALSGALGHGLFDVQLDISEAGEPEPTTWRGLLVLLEDL